MFPEEKMSHGVHISKNPRWRLSKLRTVYIPYIWKCRLEFDKLSINVKYEFSKVLSSLRTTSRAEVIFLKLTQTQTS